MKNVVAAIIAVFLMAAPALAHEKYALKEHKHDTSHEHYKDNGHEFDYGKKVTALYKFKEYLKSGASVEYQFKRNETLILWETVFEFGPKEDEVLWVKK